MTGILLAAWPFATAGHGHPALFLVSAAGFALGATALAHNRPGNFNIYPEPKPDTRLITCGPYRFIRHPMYTSLLLIMLGITLYRRQPGNFLGLGLVVLAVSGKAVREEALLGRQFPAYDAYCRKTWRFIPWLF